MAGDIGTKFSVVRYGNVMGSRGSVIPFFMGKKDLDELPITDMRMTRFWITLDQSVDLVMTALDRGKGGEIFVPKIPSMRITDLAKAIAPNAKLKEVGIRPGEKLHESLIGVYDAPFAYDQKDCYVIYPAISYFKYKRVGEKVKEGFSFSSDNNQEWLTKENLFSSIILFWQY